MRLSSKWNRRSFLGSVGVFAGSMLTPRKLFSLNRGATGASPCRLRGSHLAVDLEFLRGDAFARFWGSLPEPV